MWPNSIRKKGLLIAIGLSCMLVSQVYATAKKIDLDDDWYLGGLYSGLEGKHSNKDKHKGKDKYKDIYQVKFNTDSTLGDIAATIISKSHNINAIHYLGDEKFILSTYSTATVGGVKYESGDLIEYNGRTGKSSLYFSGDLFDKKENIDGVYIRDNGNIILSTKGSAKLGGISFKKDDIVEYNPVTDQLGILMNGGILGSKINVQALHILDDGDILFSIKGSAKINDIKIGKQNLLRFNAIDGTTSIAADFDNLKHGYEINGITTAIPEPASAILFTVGALALLSKRRLKE